MRREVVGKPVISSIHRHCDRVKSAYHAITAGELGKTPIFLSSIHVRSPRYAFELACCYQECPTVESASILYKGRIVEH
jgi:hypothetical protein